MLCLQDIVGSVTDLDCVFFCRVCGMNTPRLNSELETKLKAGVEILLTIKPKWSRRFDTDFPALIIVSMST